MSTIDELINKERSGSKFVQNGSFKVRATEWVDGKLYFIPYYRSMCSWNGLSDSGISRRHPIDRDDFEIYVEPKPKKVKHWLWTYREQVRFCSYNPDTGLPAAESSGKWIQIPGSEVEIPGSEVEM